MLESVDIYTGDGSNLITPKAGQKLWPVQYDSILNEWVTKDTAGLVQIIGPGGGGGTIPIVADSLINPKNVNKLAPFLNAFQFTTFVDYGTGLIIEPSLIEQLSSGIITESVITTSDPLAGSGVYGDFVNSQGQTVRQIQITPTGIVGATLLNWSWNGKPYEIQATFF